MKLLLTFPIFISLLTLASTSTTLEKQKKCETKVIPILYNLLINATSLNISEHTKILSISAYMKLPATATIANKNFITQHNKSDTNYCSSKDNRTGSILTFFCTRCSLQSQGIMIKYLAKGENLTILSQPKCKEIFVDYVDKAKQCSIQLDKQLLPKRKFEIYIPYNLTLVRLYNTIENTFRHGLYIYNMPEFVFNVKNKNEFPPFQSTFFFPNFGTTKFPPRSKFNIRVVHSTEEKFVAISNTELDNSTPGFVGGKASVEDTFATSPALDPTQVTLMLLQNYENETVIVNLTYTQGLLPENVTFNLWTRKGLFPIKNLEQKEPKYFNQSSIKVIAEQLKDKFVGIATRFNGTQYPIRKLDIVATSWQPERHKIANLGVAAVNFQTLLPRQENQTDPALEVNMNQIMISQWLGGIIQTNSSERSYYSNRQQEFTKYIAKLISGTPSTKPCPHYLETPEELVFLETMESVFSRSVMECAFFQYFVPKLKYSSSIQVEDFYDAIQQSIEHLNATKMLPNNGNVTFQQVADSWKKNKYLKPIISLKPMSNTSSSLLISQQFDSNLVTDEWWVPVSVLGENWEQWVWISKHQGVIISNENSTKNETWVLVGNSDYLEYFTVQYDAILLKSVITQLNRDYTKIPATIRYTFIANEYSKWGVEFGNWAGVSEALETISYLNKESDSRIWKFLTERVRRVWWDEQTETKDAGRTIFLKHFENLMNNKLEEIGVVPKINETVDASKIRSSIFGLCGYLEIPVCSNYANNLVREWMEYPKNQKTNVEQMHFGILCAAVKGSGVSTAESQQVFKFFESIVRNSTETESGSGLQTIAKALVCSKNDSYLRTLLNASNEPISKQAASYIYGTIPIEIFRTQRKTLWLAVLDFWGELLVAGKLHPATFLKYLIHVSLLDSMDQEHLTRAQDIMEKNAHLLSGNLVEYFMELKQHTLGGHIKLEMDTEEVINLLENEMRFRSEAI